MIDGILASRPATARALAPSAVLWHNEGEIEANGGAPMEVAIVDDLSSDLAALEQLVRGWFRAAGKADARVQTYPSGEALLRAYLPERFQLIFLDICMAGPNGIETVRRIRARDPHVLIAFVTTSREYAFDAFPLHPFDYLVKPFRQEQVEHTLAEAMRAMENEKTLLVRSGRSALELPYSRITAVLSQGHAVEIRLEDGQTVMTAMTFHELEEALSQEVHFLSCNRGVLINMDHVSTVQGDMMLMRDGSRYAIRVRGRAAVLTAFTQYQFSRMRREASR